MDEAASSSRQLLDTASTYRAARPAAPSLLGREFDARRFFLEKVGSGDDAAGTYLFGDPTSLPSTKWALTCAERLSPDRVVNSVPPFDDLGQHTPGPFEGPQSHASTCVFCARARLSEREQRADITLPPLYRKKKAFPFKKIFFKKKNIYLSSQKLSGAFKTTLETNGLVL